MASRSLKPESNNPRQLGDTMRQGSATLKSPPAGGLAASMRQGDSKHGGDAGFTQLGSRMKQGGKSKK